MTTKKKTRNLRLFSRLWPSAVREHRYSGSGSLAAVRISPHSRASAREEILVVLDVASGRLFRAGQIGSWIWRGLAASQPLEALAADISLRTGAPVEEARLVVAQFVGRLCDLGLAVSC